ncbi:helix-turn-helix domain-containing protein [Promicromonospora sp. NPDC052451]|uniref:helix-turn-helix domain-containing protein n=1 Tax=Promicromonospora sp. NPDC052451 TaxID=3364407 RepID=UPI0037C69651
MGQHVSVDPGFGAYLHSLRDERGWSLRRLGKRVNCSHGHLWDMEHGRKQPSLRVAALLDEALDAGGQLAAMVRAASPGDGGLVAAVSSIKSSSLEGALDLWALDLQRRDLHTATTFNAAVFLVPALRWLTAPATPTAAANGPRVVGMPDVEMVRQMLGVFRAVDNQYGGGAVRERLVSFLHHDVGGLLQGRYDSRTAPALLSVSAEATQMAGWATYDVGRHALAQRYMVQALELAGAAEDRPLGAEILAAMSHQAAYLRAGGEAVDLARAAARAAEDAGVGAIAAEAAVLEAQGHAVSGDGAATASALDRAERLFDRAERATDPQWLGYFDEAYLAAKFGQTFTALGRGDLALRFAHRSLEMDERYARGRAFNLSLVARAHLQAGEIEQAAAAGQLAVDAAEGIDSARSRDYLAEIADRLAPHAGLDSVATYRARAAQLTG